MAKYVPKIYHFQQEHMELGTMLSALDNNFNAGREQKHTVVQDEGKKEKTDLTLTLKLHYYTAWRKSDKKFIARKVYNEKSYDYLLELMHNIRSKAAINDKDTSETKKTFMAPKKRLSKGKLIKDRIKFSRFV